MSRRGLAMVLRPSIPFKQLLAIGDPAARHWLYGSLVSPIGVHGWAKASKILENNLRAQITRCAQEPARVACSLPADEAIRTELSE